MATAFKDLAGNDARSLFRGGDRIGKVGRVVNFWRCPRRDRSNSHSPKAVIWAVITSRCSRLGLQPSNATTREIASCAIIISFIHGRIAETSVGLNAVHVANEKWK